MAVSPCSSGTVQKKHWWITNRKLVDKYIKDARCLISTQEPNDIASALVLLDAALALSPRSEIALELKARSLLCLRRFWDVADMLQDFIPSLNMSSEDSGSIYSDNSSQMFSRERVKLLASSNSSSDSPGRDSSFKCFPVSDLKKKVMAGLRKNCEKEGNWRYLILGQACCHLGLMEDAMILLQTGKRLASAAFRRESICWSDDNFSFPAIITTADVSSTATPPPRNATSVSQSENISSLLSHIKLLVRRRTAAIASLDAGLYSEAIRHFSKIVDGRRHAPQGFLAECYMNRATAYKASGRIADSISDCNKTLALDPTSIQALETRASLLETIRCLPDCLHDLEHLKILYNSILRDRKLPGPALKRRDVSYREIPGKLCALTAKIQRLKQRVASGETANVDYYALIGLKRGCSRSELERAHLLLCLRHKQDKAISFIDRCELTDERDLDPVKDRAKMSASLLCRLLQKGYLSVMATIMDEEAAKKQRKKAAAALQAAQAAIQVQQSQYSTSKSEPGNSHVSSTNFSDFSGCKDGVNSSENKAAITTTSNANAFQGVFCRDLAAVGNLLSQAGFNRPISVKYEALSC
ncbi:hypothetical protein F3Y22_tig00005459pilonHSYRG00309 [Hibiscus syriacus]|uniref:Uncharacterized protein n=1 Tax=Hibiscus syriacus TaxID=106335 RepID=A0A6A3CJD4_HIBSY|nr:uncharacterized protein LOC120199631 [Hibiscus syriacus]KAE8727581.1 hypothetical protein F3Y22_tig00005459pilonHSYRG00309 [Hibiscus syriacus]